MIKNVEELWKLYQDTNDLEVIREHADVIKEMFYKSKDELLHVKPNTYTRSYLEKAVKMCLDYYEGSSTGEVIITDTCYDELMKELVSAGGKVISTTSSDNKVWPLVKHKAPFMVGTVSKCYSKKDFINYIMAMRAKYGKDLIFTLTPKLDGISSSIDIETNIDTICLEDDIKMALTRKDGVVGQNITPVVTHACNTVEMIKHVSRCINSKYVNGWIKTELVMSTENFEKIHEECGYANRRSATSGTMNTPSNLHNAKYITIIPLQYVSRDKDEVSCVNPWIYYTRITETPEDIMDDVLHLLKKIKLPEFPFRVDGVVIQPYAIEDLEHKIDPNTSDLLEEAIAFKINSQIGITKAIDIYPSIGRFGTVTPMLKVQPCDVNETTVEDVSLSNPGKMMTMGIHENEVVEVYSAGDVIPMARVPEIRDYPKDAKLLVMQNTCPYCGSAFVPKGKEYYCSNNECPRVLSGRITNFLCKLGAKGISDATIEELFNLGYIKNILDLFNVNMENHELFDAISNIPGWGYQSTYNFVTEVERILKVPVTMSKLIGSLGIENIGRRKCKLIFRNIPKLPHKYNNAEFEANDFTNYRERLLEIKGIKDKTADKFIIFIQEHLDEIDFIVERMVINPEKESKGKIVFTGFRDANLAEKLDEMTDYEYDESLNKETSILVVTSSIPSEEEIKRNIAEKPKSKLSKIEKAYLYCTKVMTKETFIEWLEAEIESNAVK